MSDPNSSSTPPAGSADTPAPSTEPNPEANFADLLAQYGGEPAARGPATGDRLTARVVNFTDDAVLVDIGGKAEALVPIAQVRDAEGKLEVAIGDSIPVVVEGRDGEGNFRLSKLSPDRPRNLEDLKVAFENNLVIWAKVTGIIKGGFAVSAGERGFMPQSRSGVRDAGEMYKLVGQEVRCRIVREPHKKNLVLDRRVVIEEEEAQARHVTLDRLREGDRVRGAVRSLATYGAFVDVGGLDALLHVSDMSWTHLPDPGKLVAIGDTVEVVVLKVDAAKQRVSVGMKQLTPDPWAGVAERYQVGQRVRGTVLRTTDFGAFVELEPGVEGLIHVSEMSWSRRVRKPDDIVKPGEIVESVVLQVNTGQRRIGLGLKQALGDPWEDAATRYAPGTVIEGRVRNLQPFGAFLEIAEGVDGMIHIGDLSEERLKHPSEAVKVGDTVRVVVLELDREKRRLRLGLKQLAPTPADEFIQAHAVGDVLSGRVLKAYPGRIELGEGIEAACPSAAPPARRIEEGTLAAKLAAVWKPAQPAASAAVETPRFELKPGSVRQFRVVRLDAEHKAIEVEPA